MITKFCRKYFVPCGFFEILLTDGTNRTGREPFFLPQSRHLSQFLPIRNSRQDLKPGLPATVGEERRPFLEPFPIRDFIHQRKFYLHKRPPGWPAAAACLPGWLGGWVARSSWAALDSINGMRQQSFWVAGATAVPVDRGQEMLYGFSDIYSFTLADWRLGSDRRLEEIFQSNNFVGSTQLCKFLSNKFRERALAECSVSASSLPRTAWLEGRRNGSFKAHVPGA